jgi:WD40 repeat protein
MSLALLCPGILVSASDDCSIKIWDIASGDCLKTLTGHTGPIDAIATTAGNLIASTSYDTIKIWDAVNASCLQTIQLKEGALLGLTFINPGQEPVQLACGTEKGTIIIFEGSTH